MKKEKDFSCIQDILGRTGVGELRVRRNGAFLFPIYMNKKMAETEIEVLDLNQRARNCLKRAGISTIGELCENYKSVVELKNIRNCGITSAHEIMDRLFAYQYQCLDDGRRTEYMAHVVALNKLKE